mgnify:CR=1 FL=1
MHRLDGLSQQQHLLTAQLLAAFFGPAAQPAQERMGFRQPLAARRPMSPRSRATGCGADWSVRVFRPNEACPMRQGSRTYSCSANGRKGPQKTRLRPLCFLWGRIHSNDAPHLYESRRSMCAHAASYVVRPRASTSDTEERPHQCLSADSLPKTVLVHFKTTNSPGRSSWTTTRTYSPSTRCSARGSTPNRPPKRARPSRCGLDC